MTFNTLKAARKHQRAWFQKGMTKVVKRGTKYRIIIK